MDLKVLGKVLFQVFGVIFVGLLIMAAIILSLVWFGGWTLLIIPGCLLYYVIKNMYRDEMLRQGKRLY